MYEAGTKVIRLTNIEEADPFLRPGMMITVGKTFPLFKRRLDGKMKKAAKKETDQGNLLADFFYRSMKNAK